MRLIALSTLFIVALTGCGDGASTGDGGNDDFVVSLSHTFDVQTLDVAEETTDVCQSWALGNEEPLYVRKVRQRNDGGWHHSNWFFVPESAYPPNFNVEAADAALEGTWRCSDRAFREYLAAAAGGVFFAQSTQALSEVQAFPEGAALEIPPRSVIVGSTHLLNISPSPMETALTMEVEVADREDVTTRLSLINFAIDDLRIPPMAGGVPTESRTSMECDLSELFDTQLGQAEVDYSVYYVLGHYHQWGNYFNLSFVHDDGSRETIFEIRDSIGEPLGSIIDPPMNNDGARRLRSECGFINNTDETLTRGLQYGEMCDFLAYTDANLKIGASGIDNEDMGVDEEGRPVFETACGSLIGLRAYNR